MQRGAGHSTAAGVPSSESSSARRGLLSAIRTLASTENPLFSQASMSAAAVASSRRVSLNQRITRRRTRSVTVARSACVIGRAGRKAGGAQQPAPPAAGMKTPSVAHTCRCTWWFSAEPKRCKKEMALNRGRAVAGAAASLVTSAAALSSRSISARKIFVRAATASGRSARKQRSYFGTEITHCRTGTGGMT